MSLVRYCIILLALTAAIVMLANIATARAEPAGREAVQVLVERHFPPHLQGWAMRTAGCETGYKWNLDAHSEGYDRAYRVYYSFWGPLQVDAVTWAEEAANRFGGTLDDPDVSMAMASWIAQTYGTKHWPVCGRR